MTGFKLVLLAAALFILPAAAAVSESSSFFVQGEEHFVNNRPSEAVDKLETAVRLDPGNEKAYLYLGIAYEQMRRYREAERAYDQGLNLQGEYEAMFLFNKGNSKLGQEHINEAVTYYTRAIETDRRYAEAYLNRANSLVNLGQHNEAIDDYQLYLDLQPAAPQREQIERMMALLTRKVREAEDERIAEVQRKAEEEQRRKEEEARQQALLEQVLSSLQEASSGSSSVSAGSEEAADYENDFDLFD